VTTLHILGEVRCLYGGVQTGNYHRGLACLLRVGMKTKGWLGDRGRSRIVLKRGKEGITLDGKARMMRCEKSYGLRSVFGQAFSKRLMRKGPALAKLKNR